MNIRILKKK